MSSDNKAVLSQFHLNDFFEDFPEPLAAVDKNGNFVARNKLFREISTDTPVDKISELTTASAQKTLKKYFDDFVNSSELNQKSSFPYTLGRRSIGWGEIFLSRNAFADSPYYLLIFRDITTQRTTRQRLEKEKDKAEKTTRSTVQILANTSHELRTPIHTIIGMTELMEDAELDPEQQEYTNQIRFSADILLALINDILDYSKMEAGKVELEMIPFNPVEIVESALDLITLEAHKKFVDTVLYIPTDIPTSVIGDPARLRQVLVNLINNAVKFTEKGHVFVSMELIKENDDTAWITIRIEDSGVGIPEKKQAKLFSAFQQADISTTRRYGGTGLGLYISRNIVDQMGGEIGLHSTQGKGTEFFFTIPFRKGTYEKSDDLIPTGFYTGVSVLIVDDSALIRKVLKQYLESWGCVVSLADNVKDALVQLRDAAINQNPFRICLADQLMPSGDGWQLASEINADPNLTITKVILMMMKGQGAEEAKMMKLGWVADYIKKPIRYSQLLRSVFSVLNETVSDESDTLDELPVTENAPLVFEKQKKILIAEDHVTNRQLFKTILEKEGFDVYLANNGREAVEQTEKYQFDLIFMDCQMPEMNGYEATISIRSSGIETPIVAVTASAIKEERRRCLDCGMDDIVTKPFKRKDLRPVLEHYLAKVEELDSIEELESEIETAEETGDDWAVAGLPIFDYKDALSTFMGEKEMLKNIIPAFMDKTRQQLQQLSDLSIREEPVKAKELGHSIKGSSRNLSMKRLGLAAEIFEDCIKKEDYQAAEKQRDVLHREYRLVEEAVLNI